MSELLIAVTSAFLGAFLTWWYQEFIAKRDMQKERFEKLYAPFEKMILLRTKGAHNFSGLDEELQNELLALLYNNYEYADSELKSIIIQVKWCYDTNNLDDCDINFYLAERRISDVFNGHSRRLFLHPLTEKGMNKAVQGFKKSQ